MEFLEPSLLQPQWIACNQPSKSQLSWAQHYTLKWTDSEGHSDGGRGCPARLWLGIGDHTSQSCYLSLVIHSAFLHCCHPISFHALLHCTPDPALVPTGVWPGGLDSHDGHRSRLSLVTASPPPWKLKSKVCPWVYPVLELLCLDGIGPCSLPQAILL